MNKGIYISRYILARAAQLLPVLFGITLLSFLLMHTTSSDTIDILEENSGGVLSEEAKQEARAELGLDKPLWQQYGSWLGNVLSGDMGESYVSSKPVLSLFCEKLPATLYLTAAAVLATLIFSLPLGIFAAVKKDSWIDAIVRFLSFIGNSLPNFFVAMLLLYVFAVKLKWLPVMGDNPVLPTLTLAISMSAKYTRQIRTLVLEELEKDYVMGARARGVREGNILIFHVLRVSLGTLITMLAMSIGSLLGGTAIVESIFMWDGVGKMAIDAIMMRDYPVIQAYVIWMAVIYVTINLAADLLYVCLEPRTRRGAEE